MIKRYLIAIVIAFAITLSLFFLMNSLIEFGRVRLGDDDSIRVIDFVRLKHEDQIQTKKRELPQKQKLEAQPAPPALNIPKSTTASGGQAIKISAPPPMMQKAVKLSGGPSMASAPSDAGSIPLVRIQPMYPRAAAQNRIEGWVWLQFNITITGAVEKARVIDSQPPKIFDSAALRAIRKWKYKPKIVDGAPVETRGVQVKLTFKLDEQ
ncbi:MAG TPA: TonB family protein [Myxococcota bacterium]|nr:TonB family protein [Myxococcota bacterium]